MIYLLIAMAVNTAGPGPFVLEKYETEQECEVAALELSKRSRLRRQQDGRDFKIMDGICLPVPKKESKK